MARDLGGKEEGGREGGREGRVRTEEAGTCPANTLSRVVFPEPLGPKNCQEMTGFRMAGGLWEGREGGKELSEMPG